MNFFLKWGPSFVTNCQTCIEIFKSFIFIIVHHLVWAKLLFFLNMFYVWLIVFFFKFLNGQMSIWMILGQIDSWAQLKSYISNLIFELTIFRTPVGLFYKIFVFMDGAHINIVIQEWNVTFTSNSEQQTQNEWRTQCIDGAIFKLFGFWFENKLL